MTKPSKYYKEMKRLNHKRRYYERNIQNNAANMKRWYKEYTEAQLLINGLRKRFER